MFSCLLVMFAIFWHEASAGPVDADGRGLDDFVVQLADELVDHCRYCSGNTPEVLLVNLVDMSQIHCTSRFGQLLPEILRSKLQERGWRVVEARRGLTVKMEKDTGEFNLTREARDMAGRVNCNAVLAGTYLFHGGRIVVNMRLVSVPDNELLSSASRKLVPDVYVTSLLQPIGYGCRPSKAFIRIKPFGQSSMEQMSLEKETLDTLD